MAEKTVPAGQITLKNVRLSHPHLFVAQEPQEGDGPAKFNAQFLIDMTTPEGKATAKLVSDTIKKQVTAKYGAGKEPKYKPDKKCMRDGNEEDLDKRPECKDRYTVNAGNVRKPILLNRDKSPVTEGSGVLYAGCFVNAIVRIWVQDNKHGKRVNASLEGVQFFKKGEAFGAAPLSADAFDEVEVDDDEDLIGDDGDDDSDSLL